MSPPDRSAVSKHEGSHLASLRRFVPLFGLVLLAGALWLLDRELKGFRLADVERYLHALPTWRIAAAIGLVVLNYIVLTGYDALALRYVRRPLPYQKSALVSFVGYAFSIALGHAVLTGGAVRYRFYAAWEIPAEAIARVIAFCGFAFWLGYLSLGGIVFVIDPLVPPPGFPVSPRILGVLFITAFLVWVALNTARRRTLRVWKVRVELPGWRITLAQAVLASLDLGLAAAVLWMLLPPETPLSFANLLSAYLLAVIAGVVSMVPGGLGVFDGILVALLTPVMPAPVAFGALVAYRGIYYLLPLVAAVLTLVGTELERHMAAVAGRAGPFGDMAGALLPRVIPGALATMTFLTGSLLLVRGALPAHAAHLAGQFPLGIFEASHFVGSVIGAALLVIAQGLRRRRDGAYWIALVLLAMGVAVSLVRGAHWIEASVLVATIVALLPCRWCFTRRTALLAGPSARGWVLGVGLVLIGTLWLGFFAYRDVAYSHDLWWHFAFRADAPRFLRGMVGASAIVLVAGLVQLLRSHPRHVGVAPTAEVLERARVVIARSASTDANLALLGDKRLLFAETIPGSPDDGFVMYAPQGESWIAMGGPVGPEATREALAWDFRAAARAAGARPVFYEVRKGDLPLLLDLGMAIYKLGEEAHVSLAGFTLEGGAKKQLRHRMRKLDEAGCTVEILPPEGVPALLPDLRRISNAWLGGKTGSEKGFSLGVFDETYLRHFTIAVVRKGPEMVAFANLWANDRLGVPAGTESKAELSIDLMRFDREHAPEGVMEYLFLKLMLWGAAEGYGEFSLGMAPLSGLEPGKRASLAPLWNRVGALLFRHGEHFYNFQGLRAFKQKFGPEWSPRYLAIPRGRLALAATLVDVAALISGGLTGLIRK